MMIKRTHVQISNEIWKRVNVEREPNKTFEETLEKMLNERDKLRRLIKVDSRAPQIRV
jgi:hypothetical protein